MISHEGMNFSQNRVNAICFPKTKKKIPDATAKTEKYLNKISFNFTIFSLPFSLFNDAKSGNKNPKIGHKIMKGIVIMLT
jgi:hypothetical protein